MYSKVEFNDLHQEEIQKEANEILEKIDSTLKTKGYFLANYSFDNVEGVVTGVAEILRQNLEVTDWEFSLQVSNRNRGIEIEVK